MSPTPEQRAAETAPGPEVMAYRAAADLTAVRAFVRARAGRLGLPESRIDLLTIAVSELATNTLQHTAGGGVVRLWGEPGSLVCDVVDHGPMRAFGRAMPPAESLRGRGLAIVERLCDEVTVSPSPEGIRVRIRLHL